jgi:hypothetical protein
MRRVVKNQGSRSRFGCRFGLRAVLIFFTGFALYLAHEANRARHQDRVMEIVQRIGGGVMYDNQVRPDGSYDPNAVPPFPAWLRTLLGESIFKHAILVVCEGESVPESDFISLVEHMKSLPRLRRIHLSNISNDVLRYVALLDQVNNIHVGGAKIDDEGLMHIGNLKQLQFLGLYNTSVTTQGVSRFKAECPGADVRVFERRD